ncbi:hypothetical protein MW887_000115 [Aspergillus wentii]|nr:hypothetical protein MW887_000115 [Aspergillus wentii]
MPKTRSGIDRSEDSGRASRPRRVLYGAGRYPLPEQDLPKPFIEAFSAERSTKSESDGPASRTRSRVEAAEVSDVNCAIGLNDRIEVDVKHDIVQDFIESPKLVSQINAEATAQNDRFPEGSAAPTRKSRSDSTATDSSDSEMSDDSNSVFGDDEGTLSVDQDFYSKNVTPGTSKSSSSSNPQSRPAPKGKRRADQISTNVNIGSEDGDGQDDDDDDDDGIDPRPTKNARKDEPKPPRLACPFYKRHPDIFSNISSGCGPRVYENSSRVKQHIERKHKPPIYCPLCSAVFESECVRDSHTRENICAIQPQKERTWATSEQLQQLKSRKRGGSGTEIEKWNRIYGILFPGDRLPDSPYLDSTLSAQINVLRQEFQNEAPAAVLAAIRYVIPGRLRDIDAEELLGIMRSTHDQVFDHILSRMRSGQSRDATGVSDSGMGASLDKSKEGSPPRSQEVEQEQPTAVDFNNEGLLSAVSGPEPPPVDELEQLDIFPFGFFDFNHSNGDFDD